MQTIGFYYIKQKHKGRGILPKRTSQSDVQIANDIGGEKPQPKSRDPKNQATERINDTYHSWI